MKGDYVMRRGNSQISLAQLKKFMAKKRAKKANKNKHVNSSPTAGNLNMEDL